MWNEPAAIRNIKAGDIGAFERVFRRYYAPLHAYAAGLTGRADIAEEIVQEFFYRWWKDHSQIDIRQSLGGYLYRSVRNLSLQYLEHLQVQSKHQQSIVRVIDRPDPDPQQELECNELNELIGRVLAGFPERRLKIFEMFRYEGKSYREIANTYALSPRTIEAEMGKAYKVLRKEIEKHYSK